MADAVMLLIYSAGGGKSLCFQIPALCWRELDQLAGDRRRPGGHGITLVISPLLSVMKDQVDALKRRGIRAAVVNSLKTKAENVATLDTMRSGRLDMVYVAPERLNHENFLAAMKAVEGGVRLLAVDEAHCISEWGQTFRPDYLKVRAQDIALRSTMLTSCTYR
jgi:superfamily II DNA helicase RecQ